MKLKKIVCLATVAGLAMSLSACSLNGAFSGAGGDNNSNGGTGGGGSGNSGNNNTNTVVVTLDAGNGTFKSGEKSLSLNVDSDGKIKSDKEPVCDGCAFVGWFNGENELTSSTTFTQNVTYTAKYQSGSDESVYSSLFDENNVVGIDINMSDSEWKKLDADYNKNSKSPIYRLADSVTISIDDGDRIYDYYYEEVGVRLKGNTSRRNFYGDDGFYASVHYKLSFKETFDDEDEYEVSERKEWADSSARKVRKKRTFGGLEKLDLKYNKNADETYVKEIFAMNLFRENGVAAPKTTLCGVSALEKNTTTKNLGVYMLYEPVDDVFLSRYFEDDDDGDLYKCSWGSGQGASFSRTDDGLIGVEDDLNGYSYTYDKKTNKKKKDGNGNLDFSSMKNFLSAVNGSNPDFSNLIDTDYFAKFEAVNYIAGNPDCIRNHYNNFYVYFRPSDGKAVFIPYDYDRCFGITKDWAPYNGCLELTPYDDRTTTDNKQENPIYAKLITTNSPIDGGVVKAKYTNYLKSIATSNTIKTQSFNALKNKYKTNYSQITSGAISSNNTAFDAKDTGNKPYSDYITQKLNVLNSNID